jgi:non-canonical purine NTP pyrophosphatase (RdgB/HAM1 family)
MPEIPLGEESKTHKRSHTMLFTFVTQSLDKIAEAERILKIPLKHAALDLPEIQAVSVEDVIAHKARYASQVLGGKPVMVEDTGLFIAAWNGLPGALVKWFLQYVGDTGICMMLNEFATRRAWATTVIALYDGQLHFFAGTVQGRIASAPAGEGGFGWDNIFIPEGAFRTFGEMTPSEKDTYSMRRLALEAMSAHYSGQW